MFEQAHSQFWQESGHLTLRELANMPDAPEPPPLCFPYSSLPMPPERSWDFVPMNANGFWTEAERQCFERPWPDADCGRT